MISPERIDIAVIGAGAAGLMAAIFAARRARGEHRELRIVAFDGAKRIGAKILISGGGRCNVTHDVVTPKDFNGSKRNQIANVLKTFGVAETIEFFRDLGVELKREDTGKLFPVTDRAQTVLDALLRATGDAGVTIETSHPVDRIGLTDFGFQIETIAGAVMARRVILAAGGMSVPKTGSDGSGFELARSLGHSVSDTFPALVPLVGAPGHWLMSLSGISIDVAVSLVGANDRRIHRERGSMLFTHVGFSGPLILDISRHWIAARKQGENVRIVANLAGDSTFEEVELSIRRASEASPRLAVGTLLKQWLPERAGEAVCLHAAEIEPSTPLNRLTKGQRRKLCHTLTALELPVVADRGFQYAEATAGGVPLGELTLSTMESRIVPRLYLCGEVLDVDGKIGGYNFQWAWSSGRLAGLASAAE